MGLDQLLSYKQRYDFVIDILFIKAEMGLLKLVMP